MRNIPKSKNIILAIHDNTADGKDVFPGLWIVSGSRLKNAESVESFANQRSG